MSDQQPTTVDMLYLDAEYFALTAGSRPPLEPGTGVVAGGEPFAGLFQREEGPVRPDEEPA